MNNYPSYPLEATSRTISIWDTVIRKIECRLASWKKLYFLEGGRINLIKSAVFNRPTYFLSCFPIPTNVASRIEKLHHEFFGVVWEMTSNSI